MERTGYTLIQDWMLDLPLSLVETAVYAMVYGFSQDGESTFKGSLSYVARKVKSSKDTARRALRKLEELGYIERIVVPVNGVEFNTYKVADGGCTMLGGIANCKGGDSKLQPHNKEDNKINNTLSNKAHASFVPPSVPEVAAYCRERGNRISAEAFVAFYESNGWMVGKNRMKDWKAAIRTWEQRQGNERPQQKPMSRQEEAFRHNMEILRQCQSYYQPQEDFPDEQ
jgi:DNA-binding Lrp family transcriptional regulator